MPAVPGPALLLCLLFIAATPPALPSLPIDAMPAAMAERVTAAYRRAEADTASADASGSVAMLLHAYEQFDAAEAWYQRASQLDPAAFDWVYLLGVVRAVRGRHEEAAAVLREAVAKRPRDRPARLELADVLLARGDLDASAALYDEVLKERPDTPQAQYGLGRVEAARGRTSAAVERFRRARELFPGFGAAYYALGLAYRDLGRSQEARAPSSSTRRTGWRRPPSTTRCGSASASSRPMRARAWPRACASAGRGTSKAPFASTRPPWRPTRVSPRPTRT